MTKHYPQLPKPFAPSIVPCGSSGPWSVEAFEVSESEADMHNMRCIFSYHRRQIAPGSYKRLSGPMGLMMSDTPPEARDHMSFIRAAAGRVLINGLGLGWCLQAVLANDEVEHVTVIEKSADVIALTAPSFTDKRVSIVEDDALSWRPPKGERYDAVWHDIWPNICTDNLPEMHTLHRRYGRRADWQGSWCRDECEAGLR